MNEKNRMNIKVKVPKNESSFFFKMTTLKMFK